jgi:catechol 2,3-dioxygenase-like lactoylglutathione lyase family enzyme
MSHEQVARKHSMKRLLTLIFGVLPAGPLAAENTQSVSATAMEIAGPVLMVSDLDRSIKFYVEGLGLAAATRLPGSPGPGVVLAAPGRTPSPFILLRQRTSGSGQAEPVVHGNGLSRIMLVVPDSAALAARLAAAGYDHTPVNSRGIFFVKDPDGFNYEIIQQSSRR